jgi:isoquinoline 1-oxidoreductase beta subunit
MGTGLVLAVAMTPSGCRTRVVGRGTREGTGVFSPDVWLEITPDNRVTVVVNKSEMGQGVCTGLPMILAEELEADWKEVRFRPAPAGKAYVDPRWKMQITGGSTSTRYMFDVLRKAGATAREMLIRAAAETWQVPLTECRASRSRILHEKTGRSLNYGELCHKASGLPVPSDPPLKGKEDFKILGTSPARLDLPEKVTGEAIFGMDVRVPGMIYGAIARPPAYGAKVLSYDADAPKRIPGVRHVIPMDEGIAVCAEGVEAAFAALKALDVRWDPGADTGLDNQAIEALFDERLKAEGVVARKIGDPEKALGTAARVLEATYRLPYLAHAPMEPTNCTAYVEKDRCTLWAPTQYQTDVLRTAMRLTGLSAEEITVHTTYLGGGFGRRLESDVVKEAVLLSKKTESPVKAIWSREDDMQNDFYRPASCTRLLAGLDPEGRLTAWSQKIVAPSIYARIMPWWLRKRVDPSAVEGALDMEYEIPNRRFEYARIDTPVPVGFWRSVGHSFNAFTVESFMDEAAAVARKDPLEFRLALLKDHPRGARVLALAAEKAGWGKPLAEGDARGLALHLSFETYVAQVAEISVDSKTGKIRTHRIVCAVDCGPIVHPDMVTAQMEGGIVFGLSAALKEIVQVSGGGVRSRNYDDYEILRMGDTPKIEVHLMKSDAKLGGVGEPGVPPVAPAVANALFAATGVRVRRLPMTPAQVLGSLGRGYSLRS